MREGALFSCCRKLTLPGVSCGVLHLKEDIAKLDKIQRRARKTNSDMVD